jgi:pyrimidine operon attenuation protein/uracil phosphoribosyltransferase
LIVETVYICIKFFAGMETLVLNEKQIEQKTRRIAHQILENSFESKTLFIGGITGNGVRFAQEIIAILTKISPQTIHFFEIKLNKDAPLSEAIVYSTPVNHLDGANIIIVDDVINSGKTMQYAVAKLLENPVRSIKTAVLVDRKHRRYPIKADYVGLTLSTTLQNHVEVAYNPTPKAFLS